MLMMMMTGEGSIVQAFYILVGNGRAVDLLRRPEDVV
jgi:hypothetical protein